MAKIIDFSDNFAIFLKLLDEKTAAHEYETAISVTVKKLEETGKTFFGELLKHRLSELYIPIGAYEENIALLAELAGEAGRSEYLAAIKMLYREMCVSGRRFPDVYGEKIDVEYLLAQAASGDMEELWDDYAFTFERESGEPVRIDVSVRNDLKNFSEAAELLASGDPEGAVAVAECVPDDSVIAELALSVKAAAAADAGDYALAERAARKLYGINPASRIAADVILKCALDDSRFEEEFARLLDAYRETKNAVELAEISRTAMLNGYSREAYAAAQAAVRADKFYYEALVMLALTATAEGEFDEAMTALYRGMRMYPRCNRLKMTEAVLKEYYNGDENVLRSAAAGIVPSAARSIKNKLLDLGCRRSLGARVDPAEARLALTRAIDFNCVDETEEELHGLFSASAEDYSDILIKGISSPYVGYPSKAVLLYMLLIYFSDAPHDFLVTSSKSAAYASLKEYVPASRKYYNLQRSVYALVSIQFIVNEGVPDANADIGAVVDRVFAKNVNMLNTEALCALVHYLYAEEAGLTEEGADKEAIAAVYRVPVSLLEKYIEAYSG